MKDVFEFRQEELLHMLLSQVCSSLTYATSKIIAIPTIFPEVLIVIWRVSNPRVDLLLRVSCENCGTLSLGFSNFQSLS